MIGLEIDCFSRICTCSLCTLCAIIPGRRNACLWSDSFDVDFAVLTQWALLDDTWEEKQSWSSTTKIEAAT